MKAILGRKMGMTQVFAEDGTMYAVTVVEVLPNVVTQVKTIEKDGYEAVQVGYEDKKESRTTKAIRGIDLKAGKTCKYTHAELKGDEMKAYKVGDEITCDLFTKGEVVDVLGTSKGRGYLGTVARYHHSIGPKGHGSGYHRGAGSYANNGLTNNRVIPGKRMPGHQGADNATVLNLTVIDVNKDKNYILIKGAVPGPKKGIVTIRSAVKTQKGAPVVKDLIDRTPKAE